MAQKGKKRRIQAYAFIDTNIFLDFYRGTNEARLSLLEKLEQVKDRVICTYQVEMEFLKNRQTQIKKILSDTKITMGGSLPAALADTKVNAAFAKIKKNVARADGKLKKHVLTLLQDRQKDRVYTVLDAIFTSQSRHVLTRDMPVRHLIKRRAWKRFILGYPPRKTQDTSTGDALNWEWIVYCAKELKLRGRFYIVSRDGDFGCEHEGAYILNDQLMREFRERVGGKSLVYTHKLSEALEALHVEVTKEEKQAEKAEVADAQNVEPISYASLLRTFGPEEGMQIAKLLGVEAPPAPLSLITSLTTK